MLFHEQANDDLVRLAVFFSFTTITYFAWSISRVDEDSIEDGDDDELDQESNGESELDSLSLDALPFDQIEQTIGESILIARETFEHDRSFTIIVKFLNETQRIIDARPMDTVAKLKRKYFTDELTNNQTVRFIYQGRELDDSQTMENCRITDQTVIHCHISHRRSSTGISTDLDEHRSDEFVDLSPLSLSLTHFLLITFVLGCIWYLRIEYRFLFKPISTLLLIFVSILCLIFLGSSCLTTAASIFHRQYSTQVDR